MIQKFASEFSQNLNFEEPNTTIEDDSKYNNDGIIYTLTGYSVELSEKAAQ